jgi:hypothetical protein
VVEESGSALSLRKRMKRNPQGLSVVEAIKATRRTSERSQQEKILLLCYAIIVEVYYFGHHDNMGLRINNYVL